MPAVENAGKANYGINTTLALDNFCVYFPFDKRLTKGEPTRDMLPQALQQDVLPQDVLPQDVPHKDLARLLTLPRP